MTYQKCFLEEDFYIVTLFGSFLNTHHINKILFLGALDVVSGESKFLIRRFMRKRRVKLKILVGGRLVCESLHEKRYERKSERGEKGDK